MPNPKIVGSMYVISDLVFADIRVVNFVAGKDRDQFAVNGITMRFTGGREAYVYIDGTTMEIPYSFRRGQSGVCRADSEKEAAEWLKSLSGAIVEYNKVNGYEDSANASIMVGVKFNE